MSTPRERREMARDLRAQMDTSRDGTCPVCYINADRLFEEHRRQMDRQAGEVQRLRGILRIIAGQDNTFVHHGDGDSTLVLDADEKMRTIARAALEDLADTQERAQDATSRAEQDGLARLRDFVELCAAGKRPDGTYNYGREAIEHRARELLDN